jgi:hypothetical protein
VCEDIVLGGGQFAGFADHHRLRALVVGRGRQHLVQVDGLAREANPEGLAGLLISVAMVVLLIALMTVV